MAANLSPEYKDAEAAYRQTREPEERLRWLKEMLRTIPKHKGTEHLQADIKTRIKALSEEAAKPKKAGARGPVTTVRAEGAAQVALLGPPNSGKSSLHARLTGSNAATGPYPFTTHEPQPGMLPFEDVQFQLVDLPPISAGVMESWMPNALLHSDAALLVLDIADPEAVVDIVAIRDKLAEKRVVLCSSAEEARARDADEESIDDRHRLPTLLVVNKADLCAGDPKEELEVFRELTGVPFDSVVVSAETGAGLEELGPKLFELTEVVRIYTKLPGKPAEKGRPFTLHRGATVQDVAKLVHRGLAGDVKSARVWGTATFAGQHVARDHVVVDGDVIELTW